MNIQQLSSDNIDDTRNLSMQIFDPNEVYDYNYFKDIAQDGSGVIVYFDDQPIGYILYPLLKNDLPGKLNFSVLCISQIGIIEEYRHQGVGTYLINIVKNTYPLSDIYLHVRVSNEIAQAAYSKSGFVRVNDLPNYYLHPRENAYYMRFSKYTVSECKITDILDPEGEFDPQYILDGRDVTESCFKITLQDEIVGYIVYIIKDSVTLIETFYIDDKYASAGVGDRLLYDFVSKFNFKNVGVYVSVDDETRFNIFHSFKFKSIKFVNNNKGDSMVYLSLNIDIP
jgi:ribosomal protein S18 acetylase RimI-like enzyme